MIISNETRRGICHPYGFDAPDDDGSPLYDEHQLGDLASDTLAPLSDRLAAAVELVWRIEQEIAYEAQQQPAAP